MSLPDAIHPLQSAPDEVFYRRDDPHDVRFGEVVGREAGEYDDADFVILGCPQDEGVKRNKGRPGARKAPTEIRRALYRFPVSVHHEGMRLFDAGDVVLEKSLEATHERLHEAVRAVLASGKRVIVLGGGNDISYADASALARHSERMLAINVDRHFDVRAAEVRNSGTPYRQLLEGGHLDPRRFHEFAICSYDNPPAYKQYLEEQGAHIHPLETVQEKGVGRSIQAILTRADADAIFWGFDLDVVRGIEAPGVSAPGPLGLTADEIAEVADAAAGDARTRVIEISEVNPDYDRDNLTAKLAATVVLRAISRPA